MTSHLKEQYKLQQLQIKVSELEKVHELFTETIAWLEKYIELAGYYLDWEQRKKIRGKRGENIEVYQSSNDYTNSDRFQWKIEELKGKRIEQPKITKIIKFASSQENAEKCLSTTLLNLHYGLRDKPNSFRERLIKEYHDWMKAAGVDINNCHPELRYFLFGFSEILEGREEKFIEELRIPTRTSFEIVQDVINNPQDWRLDEIPTEISDFSEAKKQELVLLHRSTREDDFDQEGKLNFNGNQIYRWSIFNSREGFEIEKALNISSDYLTDDKKDFYRYDTLCRNWYRNNCNSYRGTASLRFAECCKAVSCCQETKYMWEDNPFYQNYCEFHQTCLGKFIEKENIHGSNVCKLETFKTWFSELCGYVISAKSSNYVIHFAFFEPSCRSIREKLTIYNRIGEIYPFSDAEKKADEIKWKLKGDNPILAFYDNNSYYSISRSILVSPEVVKEELPSSGIGLNIPFILAIGVRFYLGNPDSYLKPLDVVKVEKTERVGNSMVSWTLKTYFHVCIYLGNSKVFHMWHPTWVSQMDAQIGSWNDFISNATGPIYRYHTPVPFKHYKKVIEHIAKADWTDLWYSKYDLWNRNCEHLVNVCKYGINWSEQVEDAGAFSSWWMKTRGGLRRAFNGESFLNENYVNNGRSSSIILKNEIERSTGRIETVLRNKTSAERWDTRNDLEYQYRIEVPQKSDCRMM